MDPNAFLDTAPGRLVEIPGGEIAFVPDAIRESIALDVESHRKLAAAIHSLGRLAGLGESISGAHLLIGPFLRREALLSSRIEGSMTDLQQLLLFETVPVESATSADTRDVANYVLAVQYGLDRLKEQELNLWLIRELHQILMRNARGEDPSPGRFRTSQNAIGTRGTPFSQARFIPPPPHELDWLLKDFERHASSVAYPDLLPQLALLHYQFEAIHPFVDGNGRVGRLLITLLMCKANYLPAPLFYLSGYLDRHRDAYVDHLLRVSQTGEWKPWLDFFFDGITVQANDAIVRVHRLLDLNKGYHQRVHGARSSVLLAHLIDKLFEWPATTAARAQNDLGVSQPAARHSIQRLVDEGILTEIPGRRRNRVYLAAEVISIVEAPEQESGGASPES